jgi:hypothetical protein
MKQEIIEAFEANGHLYTPKKRIWTADELALTYHLYNLHWNESRVDTGCGSCRRSIIAHVRKLYENYIKEKKS